MYQLEEVKVGSAVRVAGYTGGVVTGVVTATDPEIKNGRPGIDYRIIGNVPFPQRWAYLDQVRWVGVNLSKV